MDYQSSLFYGDENNKNRWVLYFTISLVCHLLFFSLFVFNPLYKSKKRDLYSVIHVDLLSLSPAKSPSKSNEAQIKSNEQPNIAPKKDNPNKENKKQLVEKKVEKQSVIQKRSQDEIEKKSTLSIKKKDKQSLKKKTYKSSKVVQQDKVVPKLQNKKIQEKRENTKNSQQSADSSVPDHLSQTLERLRDKVAKDEKQKLGVSAGTSGSGTSQGASGSMGKQPSEMIDIYKLEIMYHIQKNWAFSEQLAGGERSLEARLLITIMEDGQIRDIWFETKSGNSYLDDSAYRAIQKSNPLPPLPKGYQTYNVVLGFTPLGLR